MRLTPREISVPGDPEIVGRMHQLDFAKRREMFQLLRASVSLTGEVGGQALAMTPDERG